MTRTNPLLQGLQAYHQHDYISALKSFDSTSANQPRMQHLIMQTLTAVTNLQLCNYNESAQLLQEVRLAIEEYEAQGGSVTGEMEVLKIKVLANFLILELLSCSEKMDYVLEELLICLEDSMRRDRKVGMALFRTVMKSLFGFQSFSKMEE
jgi:hypothetical protein